MRDFSGRDESIDDSRRKPGEPHPDWERNRDYINQQLSSTVIKNKLLSADASTWWDGVQKQPDGNFAVLTTFNVSWDVFQKKYCHPFSLHQDTNRLIEEWEKFFKIDGGPISKRGVYQPR